MSTVCPCSRRVTVITEKLIVAYNCDTHTLMLHLRLTKRPRFPTTTFSYSLRIILSRQLDSSLQRACCGIGSIDRKASGKDLL